MPAPSRQLFEDATLDLGYAARTILPTRGFAVAVLSLGFAIGAATAVYGTVDWLLNRSSTGVIEPDRIVGLRLTEQGREDDPAARFSFSVAQFERLREIQDAFSDVATYGKLLKVAGGEGWQEETVFQFVSGSYFPLLGVRPAHGRLIGPEDDVEGVVPAVVLSHALWLSRFGADPGVIGTTIRLQGTEGRVVGVLPARYEDYALDWNAPTGLWLPLRSAPAVGMAAMLTAPVTFFPILGRLREGIDITEAHERAQRWVSDLPPVRLGIAELNAIIVQPERELRIRGRDRARDFLGTLLVVCVLIVAAAGFNVVNLGIDRALQRRRELAVRVALGAGRGRILRQLFAEASLAGAATAVVALGLAWAFSGVLSYLPTVYLDLSKRGAPLSTAGALDFDFAMIAVALTYLVSVALSVLPGILTPTDPMSVIKGAPSRWGWGRIVPTPRHVILTLQVGLAVVPSIVAVLFVQGFQNAISVDPEYTDSESLLIARIAPADLEREGFDQFYESLVEAVEAEPWASAAAMSYHFPYAGGRGNAALPDDPEGDFEIDVAMVTPGLLDVLGVPIVEGRDVRRGEGTEVSIVNRTLAERLWPGARAVGRTFVFTGVETRVVGVVERERCDDLLVLPDACAWRPVVRSVGTMTVNIRTVGPAREAIAPLRALVETLGPRMVIVELATMDAFLDDRVQAQRTATVAASALAAFGLGLLVVGCVTLFLSLVRDSRPEIALRMAIGASRVRVARTVVRHGLPIAVLGGGLGMVVAAGVSPLVDDQLVGISATDGWTFLGVTTAVLLLGVTSVGYAALAATRTDPAAFLRGD